MALYYVKVQEPTENPHIFHEFCVRKSGTTNLVAAKRMADRLRGFVVEYGKGVIYSPKLRDVWVKMESGSNLKRQEKLPLCTRGYVSPGG